MDRQFLCIAGLVALALVGCSSKQEGQACSATANGGGASAAPHVVERPPTTIAESSPGPDVTIPTTERGYPNPAAGFPPGPEFQPAQPQGSEYSSSEYQPAFEPGAGITPVPYPTDGFNPLRLSSDSEQPVPALPPTVPAFPSASALPPRIPTQPQVGSSYPAFSPHAFSTPPRMAVRSGDWEPSGGSPPPADWPPAAAADAFPAAPETTAEIASAPADFGPDFGPLAAAPFEPEPAMAQPLEAAPPLAAPPLAATTPPDEALLPQPGSRTINVMAKAAGADESAAGNPAATADGKPLPYDVVQVFYGTDREATEPPAADLPAQMARFLPTLASILVTLCLAMIAAAKRHTSLWVLAGLALVVSAGLALQATGGTLAVVRRSDHVGPRYTSNRSPDARVQVGICEVAITKDHKPGELEGPTIFRGEVKDNAAKHVVLAKTERLGNEQFYELLRQRVAASPQKEVFIFIHGFNVTFEDAARRTAQIHKDLKFEGAPVFFSWPAHDKFILTYMADANNIPWTTPHLKQFLLEVVHESGAKSINLIAHSMGNRALTATLRELELEFKEDARLFNQVILAAPDIDSGEFKTVIAPHMQKTANHFTLYASARDEALAASQLAHFGPRAGDAGHGLVVVPGIDTIDVTAIDTSPWGHTYYGSSDPVLRDLGLVIIQGALPPHRGWLLPAEAGGLPYWVFQPQTTANRGTGTTPR